ncbi:MAG: hypothetical protein ACR2JC_09715 [Chloroflexota bacterium]|nr:MAG: hypothetical protein DLM70_14030 [Chloroflexota bacterium]
MNRKRLLLAGLVAACVGSGASLSNVDARSIPRQHITGHLRVDGPSDLRGRVRVRGGLQVTAGLSTDTLSASGPAQIGGTLNVTGALTANGVNAGAGSIATTASLQGGSLTVGGDATVGGGLTVSRRVTTNGADIGAGGLHVGGALDASSGSFSGAVNASSITAGGTVRAQAGTFDRLAVTPGGTINFNNASITGVAGISLTGNATLSSLQITTAGGGGAGGVQALNITQAGRTSSLSVDNAGALAVGGAGLTTPSLYVANNVTVNGVVSTAQIQTTSRLTLNAPQVLAAKDLLIPSQGNLVLYTDATGAAHVAGNHDSRGTCTVNASPSGLNGCNVLFQRTYGGTPIVVVTPTGGAPGLVTGYSVQSGPTGFTIYFTVSQTAGVTFNYMVQQ